uniref:Kazal-like domain-containing protein n=1 Tax=Xenopus tropicalis TaxID=8364 RepID=A0A6I8SXX8_XENTR
MVICLKAYILLVAMGYCTWANLVPFISYGGPKCESYMVNGCPRIRSPVCGSDNNSYENECLLCSENLKNLAGDEGTCGTFLVFYVSEPWL